jgi:hypothetical protein
LYTHGAIEEDKYVELTLAINEGVFGRKLSVPPAKSQALRRYLRSAWAQEWLVTDAVTYAIASLDTIRQETAADLSSDFRDRLGKQTRRMRVCLHVLVSFDLLQHLLKNPDQLQVIAEVYGLDTDALALRAGSFFEEDCERTTGVLEQWTSQLSIETANAAENRHLVNLMFQSNVDYRRALFDLHKRLQKDEEQIRTLKELVYWTHRAGDVAGSHEWGRRLVDLQLEHGADIEAVDVLYHQANRLFIDRNYEDAISLTNQALLLAERLNYLEGGERCRRLLSHIEFMTHA